MNKRKKHHHRRPGYRNAAPAAPTRARAPRLPKRAAAPPWKTMLAAIAGGAGGAALGGLVVNQKILSPEAAGVGLMLGGGATAYFADGTARVVGTSIAAAGAGQLALTTIAKQALKGQPSAGPALPVAQPHMQLPAPPAVAPPRQSASTGGLVADLFQRAASDLDQIEDEWRYGIRDDAHGGGYAMPTDEPIVIDLDEAA